MIRTVTIGDLGEIITGNTPPRNKPEYYGTFTPFIKATDISENEKYTYYPEEYYSEVGHRKYLRSLIPKGASCVVTIGSIGKKMTMAHCDCFINQAMNAIIPNDSYDKEYVYYLLRYNIHKLKSLDSGTASGRENVSKSAFSNMQLQVIVEKEKQKRIGEILSTYDDLIENNQKQIKLLEEAAQRLYKEWFVDLRFPGWESAEIVDGVPMGWKRKRICNIAEIKAGGDKPEIVSNKKNDNTPIPIYANGIDSEGLYGYTEKAVINQESVTISARGTVGYVFLRRTPYVPIVRLLSVVPHDISAIYLYHCLNNTTFERNGTSQQQITVPMVKNKELLIADMSLIDMFTSIAKKYHDKIDLLKNQVVLLTQARDRLLPKLMSGELEV